MGFFEEFMIVAPFVLLTPLLVWIACLILWWKTRTWITVCLALCQSISFSLSILLQLFNAELFDYSTSLYEGGFAVMLFKLNVFSNIISAIFGISLILFAVRLKENASAP